MQQCNGGTALPDARFSGKALPHRAFPGANPPLSLPMMDRKLSVNDWQGAAGRGLACATWNIHRTRGADGRVDPDRVLAAILASPTLACADILALQEAEGECPPYAGFPPLAVLPAQTGLRSVHEGEGTRWGAASHGFIGTILYLRPPLLAVHVTVIDLPGVCPRGAVVAEVQGGPRPFRVVATHLSLSQPLRIVQMRTLAQHLARRPAMATVLMGDLNEWRPWGGLVFSARIAGRRLTGPTRATFPARLPLLSLDRILCDLPGAVTGASAIATPEVRAASDHLPLVATLSL
jgi:endonuclease/exonuclease/phosphatase family metal-dependent hydrolase